MPAPKFPAYRHHRGRDQAYVYLDGRQVYLGKYDSPKSHERYRRIVAEICANAPAAQVAAPQSRQPGTDVSVVEIADAFWESIDGRYRNDSTIRCALRLLREHYGSVNATQFGPLALQALQGVLAREGKARGYIAQLVSVIRRVFRWAVSREMIPPATHQALLTVDGVRSDHAQDRLPIVPVDDSVVEQTLAFLPETVADMVRLQRLLGCRPGEVCLIRPCDIDRSGDVWVFHPASHKTKHRGKSRAIFIGPKAQAILRPYMLRAADAHCFSPQESETNRHSEQRAKRKSRVQPSQLNRRRQRPRRQPRAFYGVDSYRRAIKRACEKAAVAVWNPNQLRHSAATEIRKRFGLEAAQVVLGHSKADVTQLYAERDYTRAADVMRQIG